MTIMAAMSPKTKEDESKDTSKETENKNFCCKFKSHFHVHTNKSDEFSDEDGRSHVYYSKSKWKPLYP